MAGTDVAYGLLIAACLGAMALCIWIGQFPRGPDMLPGVLLLALLAGSAVILLIQNQR